MRFVLMCLLLLGAQATPQKPATFEVASVRPNNSGPSGTSIDFQPTRVNLINVPLRAIIQQAYGIQQPSRLVVPDWVAVERFDIVATSSAILSREQARPMLQALLADRFKLQAHTETKEISTYALVRARTDRLGPMMRPSTVVCSNAPRPPGAAPAEPSPNAPQTTVCGPGRGTGTGRVVLVGTSLPQLVTILSILVGRTVTDRTELTGLYDIDLSYSPTGLATADAALPTDQAAPSIFTALQEQLGLKLDSEREKVETLVVDHIERPSGN